jgi:IS30 family transposase
MEGVVAYSFERREEFLALVCSGASFLAAVATVGVARGTGRSWWRQGGLMDLQIEVGPRGGLAGSAPSPCPGQGRSRRALTSEDRAVIAVGVHQRLSYARIGALIGRDKSVVCREVARHRGRDGCYSGAVAHRAAGLVSVPV